MVTNRKKLVTVSALAFLTAPLQQAQAQVPNINCPANLYFGSHQTTGGGCNGTYFVKVTGATGTKGGCLNILSKAAVASCTLTLSGANLTKKQTVSVKFTTPTFTMTGPGKALTVTRLRLGATATGGSKVTLNLSSKSITTGITILINVGGRMNFSINQTTGKYVGIVKLSTTVN
jgi:hypothetical protein